MWNPAQQLEKYRSLKNMNVILPKELKCHRVQLQSSLIFFPLMTVIVLMSFHIYRSDLSRNMKEIRDASQKNMLEKQQCLTKKIEDTIQDLHFLASLPEASNALENPHGIAAERVKKILVSLSNAKTVYDQLRYLDTKGKEVFRINYDPLKGAYPVTESQLQEKNHRYYFKAAVQLKKKNVYISAFDLNIEHREIEKPHKSTIRFARSVLDRYGEACGIAVINLLGKPLVETFGFHGAVRHNKLMLLNHEGYYLTGAPDKNNWGFMFPGTEKAVTFATTFPDEWKRISNTADGQFYTKNGLFTFKKIYPLPESALTCSDNFYWYMVSFVPENRLKAIAPAKLDYITLALFTGLVLFAGTLALTVRIERSHQSRKDLEKLAGEMQAFYNHSPTLITICSPDGEYLMINKATSELFKIPTDKIAGKNFADLLPPDLAGVFLERTRKVTATNSPITVKDHIKINNHERYFHSVIFPIRSENGFPSMLGISSVDITEREKALMNLKESERKLQKKTIMLETVTESVPAYIYMKNREFRYTFTNRYALEQHDYLSPEQLRGKTDYDFFSEETANTFRSSDKKVVETGQPLINMEEEFFLPDGTNVPVLTNKFPLFNKQGKIEGIIGISMDRTEQKAAEERNRKLETQLRNSHKLETLGTLSGGIAHDFNNILTPIIGFTEIALDTLPTKSQTAQDLHAVLKAAKRAQKLVKQMLTFSRQEPQNLEPQRLQPLIRESMDFLSHSIPSTIRTEQFIEEFDNMVMCDATQVQQIVMNLCTNAWQAMEAEPKTLLVELRKTTIDSIMAASHKNLRENQSYAKIVVHDTGKGMAKDEIDRMFDPFYTTKEVGKGTGLGLSVVYGIVRGHNGEITVESTKGKGTSISVFLPIMTNQQQQKNDNNETDSGH